MSGGSRAGIDFKMGLSCLFSHPASHGFTRRGGGASITIVPAEREDSAGFY